ncbi:hypothetical protein [Planktothrix agardhii]|uniref:hypothetical protein n=1 Tax=Planktothrix agardhii TaxID=1160 RepID=UPI000428E23C|nr:hypothetical protein [Planktothrix agardhii]CAD0228422.1 conserved hypothetical protein [Planktothrix agardhii]
MKANKTVLTGEGLALTQWAEKAVGLADVQVQIRLRGNHLHVLCEALISPDEKIATSNFSGALTQTNLTALLPPNQPIYKIFLSGRSLGAARPDWTVKLEYTELQFQTSTGPSKAVESPLTSENIQPIPEPRQNPLTKITSLFRRSQPQELAPAHRIQPGGVEETIQPEPEPFSSLADEGLAFTSMPLEFNTEAPAAVPASSLPNTQSSTTLNPQPLTTNNEPLIQPSITDPQPSTVTAIEVSTESLARQGYPDAIASYLSEILGGLGVGVKVTIREKSPKGKKTEALPETNPSGRRLWVLCESAYSPDPSLLAQPIAQRLRQLQLEGFRDACILLQVQGESTPDWMLRIDLTSPDRILKQWGRWGDEQAIARLINDKLSQLQIEVRTTLKESTLHLFCHCIQTNGATKSRKRQVPDKQAVMDIVIPLLDILAPQGICAATVYGLETTATQAKPGAPIWVDWLNLPAAQHSDLQPTALTLAEQGNLSALRFVLTRLVNPDLELKLATGGIRVLLLQKAELLHVMTEGATCPSQSQVAPVIAQFLRNHRISGISGVRIYGRRSGQKLPLWRYGIYLKTSQPDTVPSVLPDFVTPPEEGETLGEKSSLPDGLVLRPDLNLDHLEADVSKPSNLLYPNWREVLDRGAEVLAQGLVTTRLFAPRTAMMVSVPSKTHRYQKIALALVWATLGGLFVVQVDKILGELLVEIPLDGVGEMVITTDNSSNLEEKNSEIIVASDITESQKNSKENDIFNGSNFISSTVKNQKCNLSDTKLGLEACKLAQFLYPTFKSPQLDEQLARYQHFILTEKRPPDIMIIGSSRALRGIDPGVLETELKARGYGKLKVYNFGVNGATVQIVDLIIRQILPPEQLPKLIILADGVRALNSGRVDRTYETISASEGYQQISQGTFQIQPQIEQKQPSIIGWQSSWGNLAKKFHQGQLNFEGFQTELNQQFVGYSQVYEKRDRLQFLLQSIVRGEGFKNQIESPVDEGEPFNDQSLKASEFLPSGFLPLSTQFSPEIYYQNHSQVSGYYDGDYKGFELEGKQTTALKNLIEYVDSKNINLVFVNMPLTEDYLDQVRMAYEQKFRDFMQSISQETGITFIDLSGELLQNYNYFSDPSHLNQYGAVAVSQKLVELDQIPWPRRK